MDKQIVVYSYSGILFNNEKEWASDTHSYMIESQCDYCEKHQVKKVYTAWSLSV